MEISVIIPALNEELLLPDLLEDLQNQSFKDFEVIIADAGSSDKTREIAQEYGAKIVQGGLPAVGRNNGARVARGAFLFFLDADIRIPAAFLECAHAEIQSRYLDLATCEMVPLSDQPMDMFLHDFTNLAIKLGQFTDPHAPGFCILISHRLFKRINGFDETLKLAEDHDLVQRASQFRPLRVLTSTQVNVSVRRLEKEGRARLVSKYLAVELHRIFLGKIRTDIIQYEFGSFSPQRQHQLAAQVDQSRKLIQRITGEYSNLLNLSGPLSSIPIEKLAGIQEQFDKLKELIGSVLTLSSSQRNSAEYSADEQND